MWMLTMRRSVLALVALAARAAGSYQPVPTMAELGESSFLKESGAMSNTTAGMTANLQSNPLQFAELSDFYCAWELSDRPRKPALLIDDMQVEYAAYVRGILPQVKQLLEAFRKAGLPVFWSTWWRWGPNDGYFNTMDRFYGPVGTNTPANALYNHNTQNGGDVLAEVGPVTDEERKRVMHKSYSLDMFDERPMKWLVPAGQEDLHAELQKLGVDTVVQVGAWTDDCIAATAFRAFGLQYDVVVVEDGVSTASKEHFNAIEVMRGSVAKVMFAADVAAYINAGLPVKESKGTRAAKLMGGRTRMKSRIPIPASPLQAATRVAEASQSSSTFFVTGPEVANLLNTVVVGILGASVGYLCGRRTNDRHRSGFVLME